MKTLSDYLEANINDMMRKNHILVVIKPGFIGSEFTVPIFDLFKEHGYKIVKTRTKRLLESEAMELYRVHKNEHFYKDLCKYMSSDITIALILKKKSDNIFDEFAKLKDRIREEYGESDMRNVIHSSDSYENFTHESQIYFYNVNQEDLMQKSKV